LNNKLFDFKETQTVYLFENASVQVDNNNDNNEKRLVDDMKINLKIKENLIESINDSLVLKDAEIARLKTRIGLYERQKLKN
jgi:hypothetical protein